MKKIMAKDLCKEDLDAVLSEHLYIGAGIPQRLPGYVAGRFSLVGAVAAGGFAGLFLYFGLAVVSVIAGTELQPVAIVFFGILALVLGSAGAVLAQARRR